MGLQYKRKSEFNNNQQFRKHYGSSNLDLAEMWFDLMTTSIEGAIVINKDKCEKGFKIFMVAHYFLWIYPKNASLIACTFKLCEKYSRGANLWKWVKKIAALKAKKIVWHPDLDNPNKEKFVYTIDGTDFRTWEKKHLTLNLDKKQCSKKFNHGAVKYEIAMSVYRPKCVWINGPFRGGLHDLEVFRAGLKAKMPAGKVAIVDRGYRTSEADEVGVFSYPDNMDSKELGNFKSRARLRHEGFNGRLKHFGSLCQTFCHGFDNHKFVFEAVVVIIQYQMDNGTQLPSSIHKQQYFNYLYFVN